MSFKKAGDYLFRIYSEESGNKDFHIFFSSNKYGFAGGFLDDSDIQEKYKLIKNGNKSGIKIGDGKYIFLQTRMPFVQTSKVKELFEDDEDIGVSEEQFRKDFKDVQYVEIFESDKDNKLTKKIRYLINKSTQLLLEYYQIDQHYDNIECNLAEEFFRMSILYKLNIHNPKNPDFDILKSDKTLLLIPENYHRLFDINSNGREIDNPFFRENLIKRAYSEILFAERASLFFQKDFNDCFSLIESTIQNNFGDNSEEGR